MIGRTVFEKAYKHVSLYTVILVMETGSEMFIELAKAANKVANELVGVKRGENIVILADSSTDRMVVDSTAAAVYAAGGVPSVMSYPTPLDVLQEPPKPIANALKNCDAAIEFSVMFLHQTQAAADARAAGARWELLTGLDTRHIVDMVGNADLQQIYLMGKKFSDILQATAGKEVRITNSAGTDVRFEFIDRGEKAMPVASGETYVVPGQTGTSPVLESTNGIVVFDGSMWPPKELGVLGTPIKFTLKDGKIIKIEGGREARIVTKWLADIGDEEMYYPAHFLPAFHPQAKACGFPLVDERVYGCCTMGIGYYHNGRPGHRPRSKMHTDGEMLDISMWIDGELIEKEGRFVHPELKKIEEKLLVSHARTRARSGIGA
jgi:leucyl aminopeptidase (aminopeptidase T)